MFLADLPVSKHFLAPPAIPEPPVFLGGQLFPPHERLGAEVALGKLVERRGVCGVAVHYDSPRLGESGACFFLDSFSCVCFMCEDGRRIFSP